MTKLFEKQAELIEKTLATLPKERSDTKIFMIQKILHTPSPDMLDMLEKEIRNLGQKIYISSAR